MEHENLNTPQNPPLRQTAVSGSASIVLNYLKKHNCTFIEKIRYGLPIYRVYKDGQEKTYPRVNESICYELVMKEKVKEIGTYERTGREFSCQ